MKKLLFIILSLLTFASHAEDAAPDPRSEMVAHEFAIVQVLDKASGKTKQLRLPVGTESQFEKLVVLTRTCLAAAEYQPEDYSAFFEIKKTNGEAQPTQIFSGWMIAGSPGRNPLEDEHFDLWLVNCHSGYSDKISE